MATTKSEEVVSVLSGTHSQLEQSPYAFAFDRSPAAGSLERRLEVMVWNDGVFALTGGSE